MINFYTISQYCGEDISLIENYEQATNDKEKTWDCHHRLETDLKLSKRELIARNMYYNRPACELIFLTKYEHLSLHNKGKNHPMYGKKGGMYGKHHSEEAKQKISEAHKGEKNYMYGKNSEDFMTPEAIKEKRQKQSEAMKGEKNPVRGKHPTWMNNGITNVRPITKEKIEHYLELGYHFGRILY